MRYGKKTRGRIRRGRKSSRRRWMRRRSPYARMAARRLRLVGDRM